MGKGLRNPVSWVQAAHGEWNAKAGWRTVRGVRAERFPGPAQVEGQASIEQPEERAGRPPQGRALVMELHFPGLIILETYANKELWRWLCPCQNAYVGDLLPNVWEYDLTCKSVVADVIKMRSSWSRVGPSPTYLRVLIKRGHVDVACTDRQYTMCTYRQRSGWRLCKPRGIADCQQMPRS